jgi:hypothetical protein
MPYAPFGAHDDHFGILAIVNGGDTIADCLTLISAPKNNIAKSSVYAQDENGDNAALTVYGAPTTMFEASNVFHVTSGSFNLNLLKVGFVASGKAITSIDVKTSNGGWPEITVTGRLGCIDPATLKTYTLPDITITGKKAAQPIGFTVTAGCKLTGSGLTASVDFAEVTNGEGVPVAHDVSGGTLSGSGDFVAVTATPAWAVTLSGATATKAPGNEGPQAAYDTGSGSWEKMLAVDVA